MAENNLEDPKFMAAMDLLGRSGLRTFRIGYTDDDDGPPIIWHATGTWATGAEVAASLDPVDAVLRLCAQVIDGGYCAHCGKTTIFDDNPSDTPVDDLFNAIGCVYAWDPELKTFRRGCE